MRPCINATRTCYQPVLDEGLRFQHILPLMVRAFLLYMVRISRAGVVHLRASFLCLQHVTVAVADMAGRLHTAGGIYNASAPAHVMMLLPK